MFTDMHSARIVVGMSGGVDSSVAALMLKQQGFDVVGVFMKNWEEDGGDGVCTAAADFDDVRRTAESIGIPYYTVNFSKEYYERVFAYFIEEHKKGRTPNPDVLCNSEIKFKAFLEFSLRLGGDFVATGHYAQTEKINGITFLRKGADANKDQTYFLAGLTQAQVSRAIFPIGGLVKERVRELARDNNLSNAQKKDSTGICFIGERNFKRFLMQYLPAAPGDIVDLKGNVLGRHDGLMYYTIGQRRGLGIGGVSGETGGSYFVVEKDLEGNRLIVRQNEGPELFSRGLYTENINFISQRPSTDSFTCSAKFRYRQADQPVRVTLEGERARIDFETPQRAITAGQWAVLYDGDICLGGGVIDSKF